VKKRLGSPDSTGKSVYCAHRFLQRVFPIAADCRTGKNPARFGP
jgi:hypothetical protein